MDLILVTSERWIYKDPLIALSFPGRIDTLKSFRMKSSSVQKNKRGPEQKQSRECNFKLKANFHRRGSMALWVEILENSLSIKKHAFSRTPSFLIWLLKGIVSPKPVLADIMWNFIILFHCFVFDFSSTFYYKTGWHKKDLKFIPRTIIWRLFLYKSLTVQHVFNNKEHRGLVATGDFLYESELIIFFPCIYGVSFERG